MSKEAALRAMREARYAERTANPTPARRPARPPVAPDATGPAKSVKAAKAAKSAKSAKAPAVDTSAAPEADGRCGHRSMNGRTCTREHGHAAKSHRYG